MSQELGIDSNGKWTPHQYAIDAGWDSHCVEQTAKLGIADADADSLTAEQQAELLAFCRSRFPQATVYVVRDATGEYVRDAARDGADSPSRTPARDEAQEFKTREDAQAACRRATDAVYAREM